MRSPSLSSAPAREAPRSTAKRHARGEIGDSSRCRSAKVGCAALAVAAAQRGQRGAYALHVSSDVVDRVAVRAVGRVAVDGEQLAEVVQRAERVAGQLVEAGEVVDALVDDLALAWRVIGVG